MKRILKISTCIIAALIIMSLVGCSNSEKNQTEKVPLSEEELAYFNSDEFFNGDYMNIRNQFLSSIYESPEQINLFDLFYNGTGTDEIATEPEREAVIASLGLEAEPDCACTKISVAAMNDILGKYIGLALSDTDKAGIENFTYLEEYDAYYFYHGDTNYRAEIAFEKGEKEGGLIHLLYDDAFYGTGEKVLTLLKNDDGYLFLSNTYLQASDKD